MKRTLSIAAGLWALTLLAACGGSDSTGTTPVAAIDKFVGTWSSCVAVDSGSRKDTLALTKTNDTPGRAVFFASAFVFASADCSGTGTTTQATLGTLDLTGTKTIGGDTVDMAVITESGHPATEKQVFLIQGTGPVTLTSGRIDGSVDADGYPNTLDSGSLAKQ